MAAILRYSAYGLTIDSELELPELAPGHGGAADVTVELGIVPDTLDQPRTQGARYQVSPGKFLLNLDGIGRYLVLDGDQVMSEPAPSSESDAVRLFLLGSVFGALLHQRGVLPLHGSAIQTRNGAVLFVGPSGYGKSTLGGEFLRRGYRVLADDVCAISSTDDGPAHMAPAYPRLKLWADAIEQLGLDGSALSRARADLERYQLSLESSPATSLPIYAVYSLHLTNRPEISLTPLQGFEKFQELASSTFRPGFLRGAESSGRHFQNLRRVASQARAARVFRPQAMFLLRELADRMEHDFA